MRQIANPRRYVWKGSGVMDAREQFEQWYIRQYKIEAHLAEHILEMSSVGDYRSIHVNGAYAGWQACEKLNKATIATLNDAITEDKIVADMIAQLTDQRDRLLEALKDARDDVAEKVNQAYLVLPRKPDTHQAYADQLNLIDELIAEIEESK